MAEFRKREDITQEIDILQHWSDMGAPQMHDVSRSIQSLVRTVDPRLIHATPPTEIQMTVAEAPPEFANLPPGDEEAPVRRPIFPLIAALLLAAAGAVLVASRYGHLIVKHRHLPTPSTAPSAALQPLLAPTPTPMATASIASPAPSPTMTASPQPTASPSPQPTATPSPQPTATPTLRPTAAPALKPTVAPTAAPTHAAHGPVALPHPPRPSEAMPSEKAPTAAPPHANAAHHPAHAAPRPPHAAIVPPSTPAPHAVPRSYTVQPGDSLYGIAQSELGNGDRWNEIYEANREHVAVPSLIRPGQVLRMPHAPAALAKALPQRRRAVTEQVYTTRPGDTLPHIAERLYGNADRWQTIYELNRHVLKSPEHVPPGLRLRVPAVSAPPSEAIPMPRPAIRAKAARHHVVRSGESLSLLARRYLGDSSRWPEIYYMNSHRIANPHWIYPGQLLAIPHARPAHGAQYVVRSGDTLWGIAASEGNSSGWPRIYALNRDQISNPHWIYPGEHLALPR